MAADENALLALLNSTPVIAGTPVDELADEESAARWLRAHHIPARPSEAATLRAGRDLLQQVIRGSLPPSALSPLLAGVVSRPEITRDGLTWTVDLHGARAFVVDAVIAWDELHRNRPGRLRPCANEECALFLIDRSKSNSARWCSMATCGNKLKARRHYHRARGAEETGVAPVEIGSTQTRDTQETGAAPVEIGSTQTRGAQETGAAPVEIGFTQTRGAEDTGA